ncbi:MAG: phosphoribosyl-ATP diphosphatase [Planctomycetota bacterium]|nr:phosphoribosyl-ATP diphosphatase [Planctomycetota bacterium]
MEHATIWTALEQVIADRKAAAETRKSYVATLLAGGVTSIGAKVVEEADEVVEAAAEHGANGRAHLVREAADLAFHTLVLLAYREVRWAEVEAELARRFGVGGHVEKAARTLPDASMPHGDES